jgi:hypothetical protein
MFPRFFLLLRSRWLYFIDGCRYPPVNPRWLLTQRRENADLRQNAISAEKFKGIESSLGQPCCAGYRDAVISGIRISFFAPNFSHSVWATSRTLVATTAADIKV